MAVTEYDIAAALSTVEGVVGEPYEPPTKSAGQGWPIWRNSEVQPVAGGCLVSKVNWYVYVVMPGGDMNAPPVEARSLIQPILDALAATTLTIEMAEPYQLINWQHPDSTIPVLRFSAFD